MQILHGKLACLWLLSNAEQTQPPHREDRSRPMFVRTIWRIRRPVDFRQTLREMDVASGRQQDSLGLTGPDFTKMTKGLFDR
jgi:hypothetical protein